MLFGEMTTEHSQISKKNQTEIAVLQSKDMARILIVDDKKRFGSALGAALEGRTQTIDITSSRMEALARLRTSQWDAIIFELSGIDPREWEFLDGIRVGSTIFGPRPKILCISDVYRGPSHRLQIEQKGARWAGYVGTEFRAVIEELDVLLVESAQLKTIGPRFKIFHRFHQAGTTCCPGEEIVLATLVHRGREFEVKVSTEPLVVLDYLARTRWTGQTATQIANGLALDPFAAHHARLARMPTRRKTKWSPPTIKVYVGRIRQGFEQALAEASLDLDSSAILVSEADSNRVLYRLRAQFEWVHLP